MTRKTNDNKQITRTFLKLTHQGALVALQGAVAKAEALGVPQNITIVDDGGNMLAYIRMDGAKLRDKWADGPQTYLGLNVAGFPNMLTLVGPHNAATFCNLPRCIEQNVEWVSDLLAWMRDKGKTRIEATEDAELFLLGEPARAIRGLAHLRDLIPHPRWRVLFLMPWKSPRFRAAW